MLGLRTLVGLPNHSRLKAGPGRSASYDCAYLDRSDDGVGNGAKSVFLTFGRLLLLVCSAA
jgi:hypothetical protein